MKRLATNLIMFAGVFMLSSCSVINWFGAKIDDSETVDQDKSLGHPEEKLTAYNNSLREFGKMLEAYNIQPVVVQCKLIRNQSGEKGLPSDVSRMMISAINKIGKKVVCVPYDPGYVLNENTTGGKINRALPHIVLTGGITEFDKDMIEKERELRVEGRIQQGDWGSNYDHDGGLGYQAESAISRMTFDLQLLNYRTQTFNPGSQSINTMLIRKNKRGWGLGYYFQGSGLSFDSSYMESQGKCHAIRLLVELSVIEVLGKYFDVPYWRCIEGAQPDEDTLVRISDEFEMLPPEKQNAYMKEYLFLHGYKNISGAKEYFGIESDSELFVKLWQSVPIREAIKRNRKAALEARKRQSANRIKNIRKYNSHLSNGDRFFKAGKYREAKSCYLNAYAIFPNQKDPVIMIGKIEKICSSKEEENETQYAENGKKERKDNKKTLRPFRKVEW